MCTVCIHLLVCITASSSVTEGTFIQHVQSCQPLLSQAYVRWTDGVGEGGKNLKFMFLLHLKVA